ncbi:MAG: molybdopterin cofactor-binding domain-containing protein [Nannocystaceae bacterium]
MIHNPAPGGCHHDELVRVAMKLNGEAIVHDVRARTTLRDYLHNHADATDVKHGCGEGVCGACTVLVDGQPTASCVRLAAQTEGREIVTAAGLSASPGAIGEAASALQQHFLARDAFQCGYCASGMLASASAYVASNGTPDHDSIRHALSGNLCRCTGYQQIVEATAAVCRGEAPPPTSGRADLAEKLAGRARYPTDKQVEAALVGKVLWSAWPAARIRRIDTTEAKRVAGVVAVVTHEDIPGRNLAGSMVFAKDQPLLAENVVRSVGDAVALVAAETDEAAYEALRLIEVAVDPLPAVTDVVAACAPDAPRVGIQKRGNVVSVVTTVEGDVERGFQDADTIVSGSYRCDPSDHACMEKEGGSAWFDRGVLVLAVPCLTPHTMRASIGRMLGIGEEEIRIECPRMGGSFGKYLVSSVEGLLALLAYTTRRPLRLVLDRSETIFRSSKRHAVTARYRLGLKKDGTFTAMEASVFADAGPYVSFTPAVVSILADEICGPYHIPHVRAVVKGVLTNNLLASPMRGFGSLQVNFGIECVVEKAARQLGLDPIDVRRRNLLTTRKGPRGGVHPEPGVQVAATLEKVVAALGPRPDLEQVGLPGWLLGRGVTAVQAKYGYPYGVNDRFVVRLSLEDTGHFQLKTCVPDSGTGVDEAIARLVAERLCLSTKPEVSISEEAFDDPTGVLLTRGRPPSRIQKWVYRMLERQQTIVLGRALLVVARLPPGRVATLFRLGAIPINLFNSAVNWTKAWIFPHSIDSFIPRTSSSRGLFMLGLATIDAVDKFRERALAIAATSLGVPPSELVTCEQGVCRRNEPSTVVEWRALASAAGRTLATVGNYALPKGNVLHARTGNQVGPVDYLYSCHGCDIAVCPETGAVKVLRYVSAQDVGKVLHANLVAGQLYGGIAMGVSQAIGENLGARGGVVQADGLHDYLLPTSLDAPADPILATLESGSGFGPGGSKGVGEGAAIAAPVAIAHALYDACGTQPRKIPVSPEEIVCDLCVGHSGRSTT